MRAEIDARLHDRNTRHSTVDWQFTTVNASIKLKYLLRSSTRCQVLRPHDDTVGDIAE